MQTYPTFKLSLLRDIGWTLWDPIGLANEDGSWPENCVDEYDNYLIEAALMLFRGRTIEEGRDYLLQIASNYMGLLHVDKAAAQATVSALAQYVQELPKN